MFGSELIVKTVVDMDFLKLIFIREWTACHIYVMTSCVIYSEYYTMSGVADGTTDLKNIDISISNFTLTNI